jgi:hypothetical protein
LKKNSTEDLILVLFKTYDAAIVIKKKYGIGIKADIKINGIESSKLNFYI